MTAAIRTEGLSLSLGGRAIVRNVDMTVPDGGVYGFLGPNGAGKSTIMRLIVGLLRPSAGTVSLFGENLAQRPRALLGQVGILIESHGLYEHLTGKPAARLSVEGYRQTRHRTRSRRGGDAQGG